MFQSDADATGASITHQHGGSAHADSEQHASSNPDSTCDQHGNRYANTDAHADPYPGHAIAHSDPGSDTNAGPPHRC